MKTMLMPKKTSIYSWNINGVRAALNKGLLQDFVEKHQPDILCLQEVRAHESEAEVDFPQYIEYWNTAAKKGYSGTALFTRFDALSVVNNIPERFVIHKDEFGDPNREGRLMVAEYASFWLVNVYAPNSKPDLSRLKMRIEQWDPAFLAYCKELERTKPVVICGDLNVGHNDEDLAQPDNNRRTNGFTDEERASFERLLEAGFVDTFRIFTQGSGYYTWWTNFSNSRARNVGWRIDYFLVSSSIKDRVVQAQIHPEVMGSDHCPVSITLEI